MLQLALRLRQAEEDLLRENLVLLSQENSPLEDIAQLGQIAWPIIIYQHAQNIFFETLYITAVFIIEVFKVMLYQPGNITLVITEGWKL